MTSRCSSCNQNFITDKLVMISQEESYCQECLEEVLNKEQIQVKNIQERYIFYKQFESSLDENQLIAESKSMIHSEEIEDQGEIQRLTAELSVINKNYSDVLQKCEHLKQFIYSIQQQEIKFWESINRFDKRAIKLQQKILAAKFDRVSTKSQLQNIPQSTLILKFFDIQIDDNLGFVCGMAMGKRSETQDILWDQVNVGLGHICLGFNFLIMKYQGKYRKIESIKLRGNLTEIELKGKSEWVGVGYNVKDGERVFGEVMEVLLLQLESITKRIREIGSGEIEQLKLPFAIDEDQMKIGQYFIDPNKIEERIRWTSWTKAMRYFLINFNHILTIYSINDPYF